ncbi:MAG: hypothetical protein ABI091_16160 [Ferruginibacter sp.]
MASFEEHIQQAKKNLSFLTVTNLHSQSSWDWQITICYYVCVHIVNAHIAKTADLHYRTHEAVKNALNPHSALSICKIPQDVYLSYAKLESLSRRARYLCHDDKINPNKHAQFTYDKHFARAIRHLDKIISYFKGLYEFEIEMQKINCPELSKAENINNFLV